MDYQKLHKLARAEAAEAANTQLDGTVSTLMESNKRLMEELKAQSETELAKAHEALSAEWAKQKMRADAAEEKYTALLKARFGENASAKMMEMVDALNEMRQKLVAAEARAEKAERERDAAVKLCGKLMALCSPPKEWEAKLFRPRIKRPVDYMGSGYAFLDSFNRIFEEFTETADEETYRAIREAAEREILDRTRRMIGQKEK